MCSRWMFGAGLGTTAAVNPARIATYWDDDIRRSNASDGPPSSWSDQQMDNNDGQGDIVMSESMLGVEGSILDTFANKRP